MFNTYNFPCINLPCLNPMASFSFALNLSVPIGPISVPQPPPRLNLSLQPPADITPLILGSGGEVRLSLRVKSPGQVAYDKATSFRKEVETMWKIEGEPISSEEYPDYQSPRVGFPSTNPSPVAGATLVDGLSLTEADRLPSIRFSTTVKVSFGSLESIHEKPLDTRDRGERPSAKRSKTFHVDDEDDESTT